MASASTYMAKLTNQSTKFVSASLSSRPATPKSPASKKLPKNPKSPAANKPLAVKKPMAAKKPPIAKRPQVPKEPAATPAVTQQAQDVPPTPEHVYLTRQRAREAAVGAKR
jgi:hypothetical protein